MSKGRENDIDVKGVVLKELVNSLDSEKQTNRKKRVMREEVIGIDEDGDEMFMFTEEKDKIRQNTRSIFQNARLRTLYKLKIKYEDELCGLKKGFVLVGDWKTYLDLTRLAHEQQKDKETKKQAEEQAKQQELSQKKDKSISEITTALNQEPQLTNNDLSPQYQNWEAQINQLTDIQQITNLQDRILADIQTCRQDKKTAEEVKENLKKAQTGTKEEKEQA